jgi:hypothetical protein
LEVKKRDLERKKRQRELDDEDMTSVAHLSKQLKVAKAERKQVLLERKKVLAEREAAEARAAALDSDDCPEVADGRRKPKAKPTSLDYWQLGNKCARQRKDGMVADAICEDLPAVWRRLQSHGWAIKKKMKDLFTNDCQPSKEQADYILKTNLDNKFGIFDNAVWSDTSSSISLEQKFDRVGARMQLKASNHSGKWQKIFLDYTKKYNKQLDCIIKGMFADEAAGDPNNWIMKNNSIVGGTNYQHPHCDSGRAGRYQNLEMFPFVTLHGFGTYPFALWILPEGYEYGFLHTFDADDILFMRGDMVHAGVPSPLPRGHMEFYPLQAAGWLRRNPYWVKAGDKDTTFPWQLPTFPFGYPDVGTPDEKGFQIISYPVHVTQALQLPLKNDPVIVDKKVRLATKKRCAAQLYLL